VHQPAFLINIQGDHRSGNGGNSGIIGNSGSSGSSGIGRNAAAATCTH
jgi:hypothetical protein